MRFLKGDWLILSSIINDYITGEENRDEAFSLLHGLFDSNTELPRDAFNEPIHVGDHLYREHSGSDPVTVSSIELLGHHRFRVSVDSGGVIDHRKYSHHTPDSWDRLFNDVRMPTSLTTDEITEFARRATRIATGR